MLERWACANLMKFNATCKTPHLGWGNPKHKHRLGREWIKNSPEKNFLVDEKLNMSHPCALAAQKSNHILACIKRSTASRLREIILSLCFSLMRAYLCAAASSETSNIRKMWTCWSRMSPKEG